MNKEELLDNKVGQMNKLFITYRGKYIYQLEEEANFTYVTTEKAKLTDNVVKRHLSKKQTVGIKLGNQGFTKFFSFDVDILDEEDCKNTTHKLIKLLNEYYGIPLEDIHVWYSGMKGYHVDLYFDDVIAEKSLIPFYEEVLSLLKETPRRIERRPTSGMGVKLPMGIHRKTGKLCLYVDRETLEPMPSNDKYFLSIKSMSLDEFKEFVLNDCNSIDEENGSEGKNSHGEFKVKVDGISTRNWIKEVLKEGHLLQSHSRNDFTFYASLVLKADGCNEEEAYKIISEVITNTFRNDIYRKHLDSKWKTLSALLRETKRVVSAGYDDKYHLSMRRKEITFYRGELDIILKIKKIHLRNLMFDLLNHAKKYANSDGSFYCTHATLAKKGNDSNVGRSSKNIKRLEEQGLIEIISSRVYVSPEKCAPNVYKILFEGSDGTKGITYSSSENLELEQVLKELYTLEELQEYGKLSDRFVYTFQLNPKEHPSA